MSSNDSDSDNANSSNDIEIDIDTLIVEVQNRPQIWDKSHKEYKDRIVKYKKWDEVCENVIDEWSSLSDKKKKQIGFHLQKKWRNLKDTFLKELAIQKRMGKTRTGVKKKRPYVHFDALSFLASNPPEERTRKSAPGWTDEEDDQDTERVNIEAVYKPRKSFAEPLGSTAKRGKMSVDEDVCFTDMLIPMLRKLDDDQKHFAKVEILNILNLAKRYVPDPDNERKYSAFANNLEQL
ncbi:alcohol dehydrogenase transcription factor myb/SANT-like domain-containing protein [Phthorimaea operculella]|nr:alcohol dehydrogenase transcription factor myb/SANT-like domain-containing protein [Phthorimaea operculella]